MNCPICKNLEQTYEARLRDYAAARSSALYEICKKIAAQKNVEMERARYELEEHRLVCASLIRTLRPLRRPNERVRSGQLVA
jgi:hypothetical protein